MAITATDIARVRALSQAAVADFSDATISAIIALYPSVDSAGNIPTDTGYTETWDLYRAAADIVDQRAAAAAPRYDTSADGASLSRSQIYEHLMMLGTRLRARASALITVRPNQTTYTDEDVDDDDEEGNT